MSRQLYAALRTMSAAPAADSSLVPEGSSLDLFVTMTDLRGYRRFVPIRGRVIEDRSHQHVMVFRHDENAGIRQLDGRHDRALAFAARATSSFPGAFPPVSLTGFDRDIRPGSDQVELRDFFAAYREGLDEPRNSHFIDGGVLDNAPFGHAIDAIIDKPASTEVERWLIYLEPDPADLPGAGPQGIAETAETPTLGTTLFKALSAIPRREPVIDDLVRLRAHNERVTRLSQLVDRYMTDLPTALEEVTRRIGDLPHLEAGELSALMRKVHDDARTSSGQAYWGYRQLALHRAAGYLAEVSSAAFTYPQESSQASFVRTVMSEWMRLTHPDPVTPGTRELLNKIDVPYRERRLRFLVQGLNVLYTTADVPRGDVDEAKEATYQHLERLQIVTAPARLRGMFPVADELFEDKSLQEWLRSDAAPTDFVAQNRVQLDALVESMATYLDDALHDRAWGMFQEFVARCRQWHPAVANTLLVRFVGFPVWDTLMYPLMAVSDLEQFSPIRVARFSPDDATFLGYDPERKLSGVRLSHFGAFFNRAGRESDYLWGRLDGAEQLLGLISGGAPEREDLVGAMRAVLAQERRDLRGADPLIKEIGDRLEGEMSGRLDGELGGRLDGRPGGWSSRLASRLASRLRRGQGAVSRPS
jgi:patatin-related protein